VTFATPQASGVPDLRYIRQIQPAWESGKTPLRRHGKEASTMPEGYCVKERKKVEIKDAKQVTMKNGRPAIQGTCPDCGTKIFKIGKLEA
jgi:Domain of unknown function (DUF5679)